jgi:hypothetical protein
MHCITSVYRVITPLQVSGVSAAHHQEVECTRVYVTNGTCYTSEFTLSDSQLSSITSVICHTYTVRILSFRTGIIKKYLPEKNDTYILVFDIHPL